ncbi:MAG: hypothetical protein C4527_06005 [Candidatus Omnitrophota bacterium]|jgi:hypothetical protein|nr:MAG: hypothetical protein C4527_06005 [Candidatus Omnitrophota bacterium]
MKDIAPVFSIGLPVGSLFFCMLVAGINPEWYFHYIIKSESGYIEHSTFLLLIPAFLMAFWMVAHRRHFPHRWLGAWILVLGLGAFYFAGEEVSWGQHYFGWLTPDWWAALNDQGETNIHNTSDLFDHRPRLALNCATMVCMIVPLLLYKKRKQWNVEQDWREWFWPTTAIIPSALISALVGLPQKFYGQYYEEREEHIWEWFDVMFLRGQHSELKEHFLAFFILIYVASLFYRYRQLIRKQAGV